MKEDRLVSVIFAESLPDFHGLEETDPLGISSTPLPAAPPVTDSGRKGPQFPL